MIHASDYPEAPKLIEPAYTDTRWNQGGKQLKKATTETPQGYQETHSRCGHRADVLQTLASGRPTALLIPRQANSVFTGRRHSTYPDARRTPRPPPDAAADDAPTRAAPPTR